MKRLLLAIGLTLLPGLAAAQQTGGGGITPAGGRPVPGVLVVEAANIVALRNGANPQLLNIYNTYTSSTNFEKVEIGVSADSGANVFGILTTKGSGGGTVRALSLGTMGAAPVNLVINGLLAWSLNTSSHLVAGTDNTVDIGASNATRPRSLYLASPAITIASGTGITLNDSGDVRELVYKVTIDRTAFICAALTCDLTIATLPAKTQLTAVMADLTTTFACSVTCTTATLSLMLGRGAGGAEFLAAGADIDAATTRFGDADAELGTLLVRAAAIQAGSFENWSGTQAVVLRLTSGTGNIGTGAATNFSQGSLTFYLTTRVFP